MEQELKKLRETIARKDKIIVRLGVVFLLLLIGAIAWLSFQVTDINYKVRSLQVSKQSQPVNGVDGVNGKDGLTIVGPQGDTGQQGNSGSQGANGKDSQSTTTIETIKEPTIIQQNIPVPGPQGEKGDQGSPGASGKEIVLGKDADGNIVWKYSTDTIWQEIEVMP